jgi:succinyl-diaminopimelate desuccinylase
VDIADQLIHLVGIPSVSGDEAVISANIEALAEHAKPDLERHRFGNNLIVGPTSKGTKPLVALVGHVDTVPPQENEHPHVRDGAVWGIGSCDMKGGVAVMCDLLETLPADLPLDVVWIFYDCEEVSFDRNGLGKVLAELPTLREIDFAFVLEPTDIALELGCNGHVNLEVTFHGRSAHSARVWLGDNAVYKAGPFIERIGEIPVRDVSIGEATYREVISITTAHAGIARNVVPDSFVLNVNHRFAPGGSVAKAIEYVKSLVPEEAEVKLVDAAEPGGVPDHNTILESFTKMFMPKVAGKQGWTDVARLSEFGVDAVNFGPGDPQLCHRRDEHCPIEHLVKCRDMLYGFMTEYTPA